MLPRLPGRSPACAPPRPHRHGEWSRTISPLLPAHILARIVMVSAAEPSRRSCLAHPRRPAAFAARCQQRAARCVHRQRSFAALRMTTVVGAARRIPGCTGVIPGCTGVIPGCTGVIPDCAGVIPGCTGVIPGCTGVIPGCTGVIPDCAAVIPGCTGVIPGCTGVIPGCTGVIPGCTAVIPGCAAVIPACTGAIPDVTAVCATLRHWSSIVDRWSWSGAVPAASRPATPASAILRCAQDDGWDAQDDGWGAQDDGWGRFLGCRGVPPPAHILARNVMVSGAEPSHRIRAALPRLQCGAGSGPPGVRAVRDPSLRSG